MSGRRLLIDAGNTRFKWALVDGTLWREQGTMTYSALSALTPLMDADTHCFIASVASQQHEEQIRAVLAAASITPTWLTAVDRFGGVRNAYENPQQLGVDRWMGLVAARQRSQGAVLVVSAGTAMTVDALSTDGTFQGGLIVPGFTLMQQALRQGTARVAEVEGQCQAFPRSTPDAVQSGIVAALCGAIERQYARLAEMAGSAPQCMLTGGDAEKLLPYLAIPAQHVPALVLEGMDRVARERME
jgi:type III pantothenate kinase